MVNGIDDIALNTALGGAGDARRLVIGYINSVRFTGRAAEYFLTVYGDGITGVNPRSQLGPSPIDFDAIAIN